MLQLKFMNYLPVQSEPIWNIIKLIILSQKGKGLRDEKELTVCSGF